MQLSDTNLRKLGKLAAGLSALSANLLSANAAYAQETPTTAPTTAPTEATGVPGLMDEAAPGPGSIVLDSSVLFYQESGSRVRAIEPVINGEIHMDNGDVLTGGLTYDSLTGATPNGAAPWTKTQTFNSIVNQATSTQVATTSASGGSTVTSIPGTTTATSVYTQAAYKIPLASFHDHRIAANLGYSWGLDPDTHLKLGTAFSVESDYTTFTGTLGIAHDFNQKNTTLSLTTSIEGDMSRPHGGTPAAYENLNTLVTGGQDHKTVVNVVAGLTQTLTRFWLTQLNYNFSNNSGYQADPYRVISVVDGTGAPLAYLFESRPRERQRHSFYWGNKLALGPTVADIGLRYYTDSWGIKGITAEVSEQVPINRYLYVKPMFRYYKQSAADFYTPYLTGMTVTQTTGNPVITGIPQYASSDFRLSRFTATTIGGRVGWRLFEDSELYLEGESYRQAGTHTIAGAPGQLAGLDFFSGVKTVNVMVGFKIKM